MSSCEAPEDPSNVVHHLEERLQVRLLTHQVPLESEQKGKRTGFYHTVAQYLFSYQIRCLRIFSLFIYLFLTLALIPFFFSNYHDHPKKDNVCLTINMIKVLRRNITSEITVDVNIEVLYSITGHDFMNVRWRSVFGGGSRRVLLTEAPTLASSFPRSSGSGMQWSLK